MAGKTIPVPYINLFNINDAEFADSKYVLTSPRSLQACAKLGVKPVELLTQSFEEFRESCAPFAIHTLIHLYKREQEDRHGKLQRAIEQRDRSINCDIPGGGGGQSRSHLAVTGKSLNMRESPQPNFNENRARSESSGSTAPPPRYKWDASGKSKFALSANPKHSSNSRPSTRESQQRRSASASPGKASSRVGAAAYNSFRSGQLQHDKAMRQHRKDLEWMEKRLAKQTVESDAIRQLLRGLEEKDEKHRAKLEQQRVEKAEQIRVNRERIESKKRQIEANSLERELELDEYRSELADYTSAKLHLAGEKKVRDKMAQIENHRQKNIQRQREFLERRVTIDREKAKEADELRDQLDRAAELTHKNLCRIHRNQHTQLEQTKKHRAERHVKTEERKRQIDEEIDNYRRDLIEFRNLSLNKAELKLREKIQNEQSRIREERELKTNQWQNRQIELKNEEQLRADQTAHSVLEKSARFQDLQHNRKSYLAQSKDLAREAELIREQIRKAYNMDSFDKMARHAELLSQIEQR